MSSSTVKNGQNPSPWNDALGPFYNSSQVCRLLGGIDLRTVEDRVRNQQLLALNTKDGQRVYPAFQFDQQDGVVVGLPRVLRVFSGDAVDGWTLAGWLRASQPSLGGRSVIEWLKDGGEVEELVPLCQDAAWRFAQ